MKTRVVVTAAAPAATAVDQGSRVGDATETTCDIVFDEEGVTLPAHLRPAFVAGVHFDLLRELGEWPPVTTLFVIAAEERELVSTWREAVHVLRLRVRGPHADDLSRLLPARVAYGLLTLHFDADGFLEASRSRA